MVLREDIIAHVGSDTVLRIDTVLNEEHKEEQTRLSLFPHTLNEQINFYFYTGDNHIHKIEIIVDGRMIMQQSYPKQTWGVHKQTKDKLVIYSAGGKTVIDFKE